MNRRTQGPIRACAWVAAILAASGCASTQSETTGAAAPEPVAEAAAVKTLAPNPVPAAAAAPNAAAFPPAPAPTPMDPNAAARLVDQAASKPGGVAIDGLASFTLNDALGRTETTCSSPRKNNGRFVLIVKQWHPAPSVDTVPKSPGRERDLLKGIPQAENQIAIYKMLGNWINQGLLRTVLVEGCGYGISRGFETRYNGWNLRGLEKRAGRPDYDSVITHVGLKLEAKLGSAVDTVCADSDELIRAHDLAFSDARGVAGFLSRLEGVGDDDPKAKPHLASVIDIYRLPPGTTVPQAVAQLKAELKDVISRVQRGFEERNKIMVRKILGAPARPMALVVGGAHAPDLKSRLEKAGVACAIIEPKGYRGEDDELLAKLLAL